MGNILLWCHFDLFMEQTEFIQIFNRPTNIHYLTAMGQAVLVSVQNRKAHTMHIAMRKREPKPKLEEHNWPVLEGSLGSDESRNKDPFQTWAKGKKDIREGFLEDMTLGWVLKEEKKKGSTEGGNDVSSRRNSMWEVPRHEQLRISETQAVQPCSVMERENSKVWGWRHHQRAVNIVLRGLDSILDSDKESLKSFQAGKAFNFNYLDFTRWDQSN